jgi:hypothetical protein
MKNKRNIKQKSEDSAFLNPSLILNRSIDLKIGQMKNRNDDRRK